MQFSEVMRELAEKIGIAPLKFDADGSVALLFDGEHEIIFTPNAEDGAVLFLCFGSVTTIALPIAQTLKRLLTAFLPRSLPGKSICKVPDLPSLRLPQRCRRIPIVSRSRP